MKIKISQIASDGLRLEEEIDPKTLDVETNEFTYAGPLRIEGTLYKITNAVSVELILHATINMQCSRCLAISKVNIEKKVVLNYQVENADQFIDLGPDIREELILGYPIKPLCKPECKGLCPRCGKNLNEGGCSCGTT